MQDLIVRRFTLGAAIGLALLTLAVTSVSAGTPSAHSPSRLGDMAAVVEGPIQSDPAAVVAFWTEDRMKEAESLTGMPGVPPDGPLWPGVSDDYGYLPVSPTSNGSNVNNYVAYQLPRLNGMLFYVQPNGNLVHCSASVIRSQSKSVVLTAAHCVKYSDGWKQNVMFVPAYNGTVSGSQSAPFGKWPIKQAFIPEEDAYEADNDVAVLRLYPDRETGMLGLEDILHDGLVPHLNQPREAFPLVDVYGYPGNQGPGAPSYIGRQLHCLSASYAEVPNDPESTFLYTPNCAAMSGNSGGPFIVSHLDGSPAQVVSVVHFTTTSSRLTDENFSAIFEAADAPAITTPFLAP